MAKKDPCDRLALAYERMLDAIKQKTEADYYYWDRFGRASAEKNLEMARQEFRLAFKGMCEVK
jgi:hypothetical protein